MPMRSTALPVVLPAPLAGASLAVADADAVAEVLSLVVVAAALDEEAVVVTTIVEVPLAGRPVGISTTVLFWGR